MNYHSLRYIFDLLCDHLQEEEPEHQLHFCGGYGFEFQKGVMMLFVFDSFAVVCQFLEEAGGFEALAQKKTLFTADEAMDLMQDVHTWKGGFREMFQK